MDFTMESILYYLVFDDSQVHFDDVRRFHLYNSECK